MMRERVRRGRRGSPRVYGPATRGMSITAPTAAPKLSMHDWDVVDPHWLVLRPSQYSHGKVTSSQSARSRIPSTTPS